MIISNGFNHFQDPSNTGPYPSSLQVDRLVIWLIC